MENAPESFGSSYERAAVGALLALAVALVVGWAFRVRAMRWSVALGRGARRRLPRVGPFLTLIVALSSPALAAERRSPASPGRDVGEVAPPWSATGGVPPPPPLVRTGASASPSVDGAIRARVRSSSQQMSRDADLERARELHPSRGRKDPGGEGRRAGRRSTSVRGAGTLHGGTNETQGEFPTRVVRPGDSLWGIAASIVDETDPAAIARVWPRIYRQNRALIGNDPNLVLPGQVLRLPHA